MRPHDYVLALLSALFFFSLALWAISFGHPHEDAYILYIYSEQLANTGSISYFAGGPHAEGATDFLWMLALSFLNLAGLNSAVAATILNAIGVFLINCIVSAEMRRYGDDRVSNLVLAAFVPLFSVSQAAIAGFSTSLYAALCLLLFFGVYRWSPDRLKLVPLLSIGLGLFRPDGVILGVTATAIGLAVVRSEFRVPYLRNTLIASAIGAAYFLWRYAYFGELLPLPLYVKSDVKYAHPGLAPNLEWLEANGTLAVGFLCSILLIKDRKRYLLATLPAVALLAALTFAYQIQNVAYRFQAPASIVLLFGSAISLAIAWDAAWRRELALRLVLVAGIVVSLALPFWNNYRSTIALLAYLTNDDYANFLPYYLRPSVSRKTKIALTEAGRLAYWLDGEKYDLVGLNTREPAKFGATPQQLEKLDPDLIFIHTAGTFLLECEQGNYCEVSIDEILKDIKARKMPNYARVSNRVLRAPLAACEYIGRRSGDYRIYLVRYGGSFVHLYALRKTGSVSSEEFRRALDKAFDPQMRLSYLGMIEAGRVGLQGSGRVVMQPGSVRITE